MKGSSAYVKFTQVFLWLLCSVAICLLVGQHFWGEQTLDVLHGKIAGVKVGIGLRFDMLSALLVFMVTALGATIGHYGQRYLNGEVRQPYFYKYLTGIVLSASLLTLASNLLMFFFMWLAVSYNLHQLLVYYKERPQAVMAARKKSVVSRIGDLALLAAIVLIYRTFDSFEFADIFAQLQSRSVDDTSSLMLSAAGVLIALGALTKSAQFPFHFWLPETMETPTPVSALMHAGVINAGGFLIIRMSPLLQYSVAPHVILVLVGTISAVFGALCMIVQNDIKKKLAYSTISQMGMMMLACGLGAYSIALFHIFAHSFYKAYAFLATGKLVQESNKVGYKLVAPSMAMIAFAGAVGLAAIFVSALYDHGEYLPLVTYGSILWLGLLQNTGTLNSDSYLKLRAFGQIALVLCLSLGGYALLEYTLNSYLKDIVPSDPLAQLDVYMMTGLSVAAFTICLGSFYLTARLMNINSPFLERVYLYLRNGGYLGLRTTVLFARINPVYTTSK